MALPPPDPWYRRSWHYRRPYAPYSGCAVLYVLLFILAFLAVLWWLLIPWWLW